MYNKVESCGYICTLEGWNDGAFWWMASPSDRNEAKIAGYFLMAAASPMILVLNTRLVEQKGGYSAL
jgi:hypothetical protein